MKHLKLLIILLFSLPIIKAQDKLDAKNPTVSKNEIESQIKFLAADELKGRKIGSNEIDIAALYLANTLRGYNVEAIGDNNSFYQYVPIEKASPAKKLSIKLNDFSTEKLLPIQLSDNLNLNSEAIYLNFGSEADYKGKDVKGKVIIAKVGLKANDDPNAGFSSIVEKQQLAKKFGAAGLIELVSADDDFFDLHLGNANVEKFRFSDSLNDSFIHFWIQDINGIITEQIRTTNKVNLELNVSGIEQESFLSRNVVGLVEGTDPELTNEFIIYSAHYDHLGVGKPNADKDSIYNGARDNAVGVAAVLNAAKSIALKPTKRSAIFILFTGEEVGLLGSKWYVEHPMVPLNKTVYCFNSDNGGYNDTSIVTIVGLNRTTANENIVNALEQNNLNATNPSEQDRGLFYFSDNISFSNKGIPSSTYSLGFTAFDAEIYKNYHQASDNENTLDYDYLVKFVRSYVLASRLIANDNARPFWTEGDQFYKTGKELYQDN